MTFYVTVRCTNRSFRLVPKPKVRESIAYAFATILAKYRLQGKLQVHEFVFMSNHFHLLGTDIVACLPDFVRELNSLISRQLNSIRAIRGQNFENGYGLVEVQSQQRILEHAVYTLANPVSAFLVATSRQWRGLSSIRMKYGVPVVISKPNVGLWTGAARHSNRRSSQRSKRAQYANRSVLPDTVELVIDRPPVMLELSDDELRALILERLEAREQELAAERIERGISLVGRRNVESLHFMAIPGPEEMFGRKPSFSASSVGERVRLARVRAAFLKAYALARDAFIRARGRCTIPFPQGTWFVRRHYDVPCVPLAVT